MNTENNIKINLKKEAFYKLRSIATNLNLTLNQTCSLLLLVYIETKKQSIEAVNTERAYFEIL